MADRILAVAEPSAPSWTNAHERFYQLSPYYPRCSFAKNAVLSRPRDRAMGFPYMQFNSPSMYAWLVFDLDDVPDGYSWEDAGVAPPNLVVRSRTESSQHWYYAISPVTRGANAREHPIAFMKAVYAAMVAAIGPADPSYNSGPVARTPGHRLWHTVEVHSHEYSLGELADYVDLESRHAGAGVDDEGDHGSRHLWLFHYLRKAIAYPCVDQYRERNDYAGFLRHIQASAAGANTFAQRGWSKSNLSAAQVRAVCKSIARWTWTRYRGRANGCARGVMALDVTLPLQVRQSLSARRTHSQRTQRTRQRIEAAVRSLQDQGLPLTFTAVAAESGLSRQTVSKYRELLDRVSSEKPPCPIRSFSSGPTNGVKFGAHKIVTGCGTQPEGSTGNMIGCHRRRRVHHQHYDREACRIKRAGGPDGRQSRQGGDRNKPP